MLRRLIASRSTPLLAAMVLVALAAIVGQRLIAGSAFGKVTLFQLGTHTSGLPLQFPQAVTSEPQMLAYLKTLKPPHPPGTSRTYSNPGIGILGLVSAQSLGGDFTSLVQEQLFPAISLSSTYLELPPNRLSDYAQGYSKTDQPVRMSPGLLAAETYGVRTTAADLTRWLEANLGKLKLDPDWQRAILATHTGYARMGPMTQDLVWEQYPYPATLDALLAGNAQRIVFEANPAVPISPPLAPRDDVLINKTGSTAGFASYVAFVPSKGIGVVLLANKAYPAEARIEAAYKILQQLD